MKKMLFFMLLSGAMSAIAGAMSEISCNPSVNPVISGSSAPCSCSFSACQVNIPSNYNQLNQMAKTRAQEVAAKLTSNYTYLNCSCPDKRLNVALPNAAIAQGISLAYNGSSLQITTPSNNTPTTICQGYDGCLGYCSFANGVASCTWGSSAPLSWLVPQR